MARAFVIRPFGPKKDSSGIEIDFEHVHRELIGPALQAAELSGETTSEIVDAGNIREDMFGLIFEADVVVFDITILNANVFYELGVRHAVRPHATALIFADGLGQLPFDVNSLRGLPYKLGPDGRPANASTDVSALAERLRADRLRASRDRRLAPDRGTREHRAELRDHVPVARLESCYRPVGVPAEVVRGDFDEDVEVGRRNAGRVASAAFNDVENVQGGTLDDIFLVNADRIVLSMYSAQPVDEHVVAVEVALKNQMDLSLSIALGSSLQIAFGMKSGSRPASWLHSFSARSRPARSGCLPV